MDLVKLLGSQKPSNFNDPFMKNSIDSISINMRHERFDKNKIEWYARIHFKNGSTEGTQKFDDCGTLEEVLTKMQQFAATLR